MKIEDYGIIIACSKFGDTGLVVKILSREHGIIKGLVKGQKRNSNITQAGNFVHFVWSARLSEHLGLLSLSLERAYPLINFSNYQKILSISSICSLIDILLPERDNSANIYDKFIEYLNGITGHNWLKDYVMLELFILEKTGFGFDFVRCAVSGNEGNVIYISPKTGVAISKEVGEPYKSRLFIIPTFFLEEMAENTENQPCSMQEIIDGLEITRYFLAKHFFAENLAKLPSACIQFRDEILRYKNSDVETRQNRDNQLQGSA